MIAEALAAAADPRSPRVAGPAGGGEPAGAAQSRESWGGRTRRVLMTGVSYMIPFVAAGGLLIALGFLFGGYEIALNDAYGQIAVHYTLFHLPNPGALGLHHALFGSPLAAYVGALSFILGKTAFAFFIPALAGYIAFAIADRPGIAPGFVMGGLAANIFGVVDAKGVSVPVTGYLGAIVGGVLAGLIAHWIGGWKVPSWSRGLMPVLIIPLITVVLSGAIMLLILGKPIAWVMTELNNGLNSLNGGSVIILGVVLGLMMAFDMGGPVNKVAYSFAVADPLRVIPAIMLGSAVTGGLSEALDVAVRAPHGGIFVIFAVHDILGYVIALAAGVAVGALAVITLKSLRRRPAAVVPVSAAAPAPAGAPVAS